MEREIRRELADLYEEEMQKFKKYLEELTSLPLPEKIKNTILERESDRIYVSAMKKLLKQAKGQFYQLRPYQRNDAENYISNMEKFSRDIENRWIIYGNPQGSDDGNEIRPLITRKQIFHESHPIIEKLYDSLMERFK